MGFALGIVIFHNVPVALVIAIGAMIPDLDREYLFVAKDFIGKHQLHRSLFHNFLFIGLIYLLNPFLALGALSHSLLDSFTSATDRGVELLFPFNRLIKGFKYDIEGNQLTHLIQRPKKRIGGLKTPGRCLKKPLTETCKSQPINLGEDPTGPLETAASSTGASSSARYSFWQSLLQLKRACFPYQASTVGYFSQ